MAKLELEFIKLQNIFKLIITALEAKKFDDAIIQINSFFLFVIETIPLAFKTPEFNFEKICDDMQVRYKGIETPFSADGLRNGAILMEVLQQDYANLVDCGNDKLMHIYSIIKQMFKLFAAINNTNFCSVKLNLDQDVAPFVGKLNIPWLCKPSIYTVVANYSFEVSKQIAPLFWFWQKPKVPAPEEKNNPIDSSSPAP